MLAARLHLENPVLTAGIAHLVDIYSLPCNVEHAEQSRWFELAPDPVEGHKDNFELEAS
jgi:hypothetical protein